MPTLIKFNPYRFWNPNLPEAFQYPQWNRMAAVYGLTATGEQIRIK